MKKTLLSLALALAATGCPPGDRDTTASSQLLTIKGSDTMVHLVTSWSEAYMAKHPDAEIAVTGGGSGTGIAALLNGTTDLCMSSRSLREKELELAQKQEIEPKELVVGRDGIAVVAHPDNPIDALSLDQLRQIYNGTLQSWSQVGGPDRPIQVLSRESNSGTYVFFNEHVLKKDDYGPKVRLMPSSAAIVTSVSQDAWSIGYVGLGYAEEGRVKVLGVRQGDGEPVRPALETVRDGSYPISRPLLLYSAGEPQGLAKAFVEFARSPAGQEIVEETGYIPLQQQP